MNNVYVTAVSQQNAEMAAFSPWVTSHMLGQQRALPYFRAFNEPLLSVKQLYAYLDWHIAQILQQRGWSLAQLRHIPIFLGSTSYLMSECEFRWQQQQPLPTEYNLAVIAQYLQQRYQTNVFSLATSCTSSAQAIGVAYQMLAQGRCQQALVIGFEMFNRLTFEHFAAMNLLAETLPYQPLRQSHGMILGEGIACVALETQPNLAQPYQILAVTTYTDQQNLTQSSQEALVQLWQQCLQRANLTPTQLAGIKVHAIGGISDDMEITSLRQWFPNIPCLLAKPTLGHCLGASGAMETAWLYQQLQQAETTSITITDTLPPTAQPHTLSAGYYLNYFLGFGGSNIAWIVKWQ